MFAMMKLWKEKQTSAMHNLGTEYLTGTFCRLIAFYLHIYCPGYACTAAK